MKILNRMVGILGAFLILMGARTAVAHPGSRVEMEIDGPENKQAGVIDLKFQLIDEELKKLLTANDLNVVHEKKLHMFVYDEALKELKHIHPESENDFWKVSFSLDRNGNYFVWAQGEINADGEEFSAFSKIEIEGGSAANPLPPELGERRLGNDGVSQVTLSNQKFRAGKQATPTLTFSRTDGTAPELKPWLGAPAHILIASSAGDSIVHAHPMDHGTPNALMLHTEFPKAGDYRIWVQFMDGDVLKTVPLSVTVFP